MRACKLRLQSENHCGFSATTDGEHSLSAVLETGFKLGAYLMGRALIPQATL